MQAVVYRKLSELVDRFKGERSTKTAVWTKRLFEALDWGSRSSFAITQDEGQGFRLLVDNFPVINILTESPNNIDRVYRALNRAYNQDVSWVVATDFRSLGIFGSQWVSFPHTVESALALKVDHSNYLAEAHHLALLTPYAVARNKLDDLYSDFSGRKRRIPIDFHLVERMREWRQLGLSALNDSAVESDPLIHRLINSLFLIRYLEDIKKLPSEQLLNITKQPNKVRFTQELRAAFNQLATRTGYSVPNARELKNLDQTPLRHLIQQLYGYPDYGINYDFAEMSVDILGRFYEEYLRLDVVPVQEKKAALTLFDPPTYEMEDVRRQRGVYFTPRYLVDYVLNSLIDRFKQTHRAGEVPFIADIAAGSGTFLSAAIDHLIKAYPKLKTDPSDLANRLIGLDVDSRATEAARMNLTAKLIAHSIPEPVPPLQLACVDLLFGGPLQEEIMNVIPEGGADIIVSNPPYIKYETLKQQYDVSAFSGTFETTKGRTDSYIMFVEAALKLLKAGGLCGLVLPNSILRTQSAGPLRQWLTKRADIIEIIDFVDQPVFQAASIYVCLLLFRRRSPESVARKVTVARVYDISKTPASQLASISVADDEPPEGCDVFRMDQPSGAAPWDLRNEVEIELFGIMKEASDHTVNDVLQLRQGVKTGRDDVFIVEASQADTNHYVVRGKSGSSLIEREALIPVFRNRDLRRWGARASAFLIYPYDKSKQQLLSWTNLQAQYPKTAAYLSTHRPELSKRKSLRGRKVWYDLIESRIQTITSDSPHLIISELSLRPVICRPNPANAAIVGNAWLILHNLDYDLDVLMAYLNSTVAEWYLRQVSPLLQGGYILLRQNNLSRLPLPRFLRDRDEFIYSELKRLSSQLTELMVNSGNPIGPSIRNEITAIEKQIDSLIMDALRLKSSQADQLRRSVALTRGLD